MPARRSLRTRNALTSNLSPPAPAVSTRPRRTASGPGKQVTIARESSDSPEGAKKAIHLTVKMPSNKLREATSSGRRNARDGLEPTDIITGPRSNRGKKSYVVESESDDEEEEEEEDAEDEIPIEDQIGEPEATDDDMDEDDEEEEQEQDEAADEDDAESGDGDEDEDVEMEDGSPVPPPPVVKMTGPASKPSVTITPAQSGKVKSVEGKEMEMEDDDEDLSSINSDGEEDAEGEDVEEGDEMDQDDEGDRSTGLGSRASTPDVSKMTKRQKSRLNEVMGSDFLQLPMEPQTKKHLTAEEHAMRRAEMARRRKNLSEKRNEEEKMDTINRLLKKQAPKRRGKISQAEITANAAAGADTALSEEPEIENANPVYVRWISDAKGYRLGVPGEWLGGPAGRVFGGISMGGSGKMIEEVKT